MLFKADNDATVNIVPVRAVLDALGRPSSFVDVAVTDLEATSDTIAGGAEGQIVSTAVGDFDYVKIEVVAGASDVTIDFAHLNRTTVELGGAGGGGGGGGPIGSPTAYEFLAADVGGTPSGWQRHLDSGTDNGVNISSVEEYPGSYWGYALTTTVGPATRKVVQFSWTVAGGGPDQKEGQVLALQRWNANFDGSGFSRPFVGPTFNIRADGQKGGGAMHYDVDEEIGLLYPSSWDMASNPWGGTTVAFTAADGDRYWTRVSYDFANNTYRWKAWPYGDPEPGSWTNIEIDASYDEARTENETAVGLIGWAQNSGLTPSGELTLEYFDYSTDPDVDVALPADALP